VDSQFDPPDGDRDDGDEQNYASHLAPPLVPVPDASSATSDFTSMTMRPPNTMPQSGCCQNTPVSPDRRENLEVFKEIVR
jgi:hypothetical protein